MIVDELSLPYHAFLSTSSLSVLDEAVRARLQPAYIDYCVRSITPLNAAGAITNDHLSLVEPVMNLRQR
jgi:hypothetical protein